MSKSQLEKDSTQKAPSVKQKRDVIRQAPHRITGGHTVPDLAGNPLTRESELEQKVIKLVICCHDVTAIDSQKTIDYTDSDGSACKYTPDLQVVVGGKLRHIEVKPLTRLLDPEKRAHYAMIFKCLMATGNQLDFITDDQAEILPRVTTADLLKRYRCHPIPDQCLDLLKEELSNGPISIRSILMRQPMQITLADLYAAISQRHLWIDWSISLSPNCNVALPYSGYGGLSYEDVLRAGRHGLVLERLVLGGGSEAERILATEKTRRKRLPSASPLNFF